MPSQEAIEEIENITEYLIRFATRPPKGSLTPYLIGTKLLNEGLNNPSNLAIVMADLKKAGVKIQSARRY
ncbi:MAG: hypothetical protein AB1401_00575 [Thermodesulfobacteriota bacterium]